jgi:hypothetical protein
LEVTAENAVTFWVTRLPPVWAHHTALFKIRDVKNPVEFLVAVLAEKNVVRHGPFLLDPSSLHT